MTPKQKNYNGNETKNACHLWTACDHSVKNILPSHLLGALSLILWETNN